MLLVSHVACSSLSRNQVFELLSGFALLHVSFTYDLNVLK